MSPTPAPRSGPRTPATAGAPMVVPAGWAAANPVDDGEPVTEPVPAAPAARRRPPATGAAARTAEGRPATTRPSSAPAPAVGVGAPRTDQTGKPRVDWKAYDAQVYDTAPEWVLYRCWTRVPIDGRWWARWWQHFAAFFIGYRYQLLWIGISVRAGIARATEHLADKSWRRMIHRWEIDPDVSFATEREAELYEDGRIAAECPRFNTRGNDRAYNPGAVHLTKRFHAQHRADQRQQAGQLALGWFALAALFTWLLYPDAAPGESGFIAGVGRLFTGIMYGVAGGAVAMTFWRIAALAIRGQQPTTAQKARLARRAGG
jgi:hypothetical protein